jgi:hypothetical protein
MKYLSMSSLKERGRVIPEGAGPCQAGVCGLLSGFRAGYRHAGLARGQVLHAVRAGMPGGLGQRPAVVIIELTQQAVHHVAAGQPRVPPGEARRGPRQQVLKETRVRVMVYRCISGCRVIVLFHKLA